MLGVSKRDAPEKGAKCTKKYIQIILGAFSCRLRKSKCVIGSINKLCNEGFNQLHYLRILLFKDVAEYNAGAKLWLHFYMK